MLLFVRKEYAVQIASGVKTFEIRAGSRYRNIAPGRILSINGQQRVEVTRVERHTRESLLAALPDWAAAVESCYPDNPGPYFVLHFRPAEEHAYNTANGSTCRPATQSAISQRAAE